MFDKNIFTRDKIHDKKMRLVIVRLDYICDCEFSKLKSLFEDAFQKSFSKAPEIFANHNIKINLTNNDFASISRNLNIPVDEIKDLQYVRYSGFKRGNCDAWIDISQCYMCLTIKCENNYDGLTEYVEPIKGAMTILQNKGVDIRLKRFGLRKIRVEDFYKPYNYQETFEPFVFSIPTFGIEEKKNLKSEYFDVFTDSTIGLRSNIRRMIEHNVDTNNEPLVTATLDIDSYFHLSGTGRINIRSMLESANNKEFELYRECMTYGYLESIYG